jgi:hypothetical protein
MWRGLITMNLFLLTLWSTLTSCDILRFLREIIRWKRLEIRRNHNWLLHHNSAPANTSLKPRSLWLTTKLLSFPILPTHWSLPPVISFCFPNWKWNCRDNILKHCLIQRDSQAVLDSIK